MGLGIDHIVETGTKIIIGEEETTTIEAGNRNYRSN